MVCFFFLKKREELSISLLMYLYQKGGKDSTRFLRLFFNGTVLVALAWGYQKVVMVYRYQRFIYSVLDPIDECTDA